jgi:hypothetical protein
VCTVPVKKAEAQRKANPGLPVTTVDQGDNDLTARAAFKGEKSRRDAVCARAVPGQTPSVRHPSQAERLSEADARCAVVRPRQGRYGDAEARSRNLWWRDPDSMARVAGGRHPLGQDPSKTDLALPKENPTGMSNRVPQFGYCFVPRVSMDAIDGSGRCFGAATQANAPSAEGVGSWSGMGGADEHG